MNEHLKLYEKVLLALIRSDRGYINDIASNANRITNEALKVKDKIRKEAGG